MRRRNFLGVLCGAVVATVPFFARAQQTTKVYRIAVVSPAATSVALMSETGGSAYYRAFFERLRQLGYVEGQNLVVERYSGENRPEHYAELAREIVRGSPDLILASATALALEFKAATDTIPVVAVSADPVAYGVAASLPRPGGNITGVTVDAGVEIMGKCLEFLREMVPAASRIAWLASRPREGQAPYTVALQEAARKMQISLVGPPLQAPFNEAEFRRVFAAMAQAGADALLVGGGPENFGNRQLIVELAEKARLPAIYFFREFTDIGGLMSYGVSLSDLSRHAADQIDQILKGAKPGDIPFYQPTKFELIINLRTAKALGITMPPTLLIAADEVIE
ncbi:MAG TPA: ABC transporter substrate-binding protein [Stellaceae bacterium]|nr:ABC transporter substrate-binding protein [Stellaceae bacterium]